MPFSLTSISFRFNICLICLFSSLSNFVMF
jgi:hypothetical protein